MVRFFFLPTLGTITGMLILLSGCKPIAAGQPDAAGAQPQTPVVEIINADDALSIRSENGGAAIDIVSPRGIGGAHITFAPAQTTDPILLRFYLQGMEQAVFDNGDARLEISVSSHPPYTVSQSLSTAQETKTLAEGDKFWADVQLVAGLDAPPMIPLQNGHIDVTLPHSFVDESHPILSLQWIDFYR